MELRPIPGHDGYYASDAGEIYSLQRSGELYQLKQRVQNNGRLYVRHPRGWTQVSRLVCAAFHGPAPRGSECRHFKGKLDNRPQNLAWGSKNKNFLDLVLHQKTKLTPRLVRDIRGYLCEGASMTELAEVFNVSPSLIWYIGQGIIWRRQGCGLTAKFREWQEANLSRPVSAPK